jgi:hypothetical protein
MHLMFCEMHKCAQKEILKYSGPFAVELGSEEMSLGQNFMWFYVVLMVMGIVQKPTLI